MIVTVLWIPGSMLSYGECSELFLLFHLKRYISINLYRNLLLGTFDNYPKFFPPLSWEG